MAAPFIDQTLPPTETRRPTRRAPDRGPDRGPARAPIPAWFALRCSVPDGAQRASAWRSLKKMGAVNVQRSLWIVRDDPEQRARAEGLQARVAPPDGCIEILDAVPASEARAVQTRLQRACERQWDDLVDRLDDHDDELAGGSPSMADRLQLLTELTDEHARRAALDLVSSATGTRVAERIRRAAEELAADAAADGFDDATWRRTRSGLRRHVRLVTSWPLVDGRRCFIAALHPQVDPLWEVSFERFEAATYLPDDDRISLRAGVFRWIGTPGSDDDTLNALSRRVEHFEATLG